MDYNYIPVESVQERDVDLLLIEELNVSLDFCKWFISAIGLGQTVSNLKAFRSISDYGLGETDILISYSFDDRTTFILVENKIDASFQENQFERYKERGKAYLQSKKCDDYHIALVAPKSYCENQSNFSNYVSYESIKKYFADQKNIRADYKAEILSIAIEKERLRMQKQRSAQQQQQDELNKDLQSLFSGFCELLMQNHMLWIRL